MLSINSPSISAALPEPPEPPRTSGLGPAASKSSPGSDTETKSLGNAFAATSPSRIFFKVSSRRLWEGRWGRVLDGDFMVVYC